MLYETTIYKRVACWKTATQSRIITGECILAQNANHATWIHALPRFRHVWRPASWNDFGFSIHIVTMFQVDCLDNATPLRKTHSTFISGESLKGICVDIRWTQSASDRSQLMHNVYDPKYQCVVYSLKPFGYYVARCLIFFGYEVHFVFLTIFVICYRHILTWTN